jgi:hypothetical protein
MNIALLFVAVAAVIFEIMRRRRKARGARMLKHQQDALAFYGRLEMVLQNAPEPVEIPLAGREAAEADDSRALVPHRWRRATAAARASVRVDATAGAY